MRVRRNGSARIAPLEARPGQGEPAKRLDCQQACQPIPEMCAYLRVAEGALGDESLIEHAVEVELTLGAADLELRGMDGIAHGEEGYATGDGAVLILEDE